jgi:hypothetical protein
MRDDDGGQAREDRKPTLVMIERHGRTMVLTGWRAWLAAFAALLVVSVLAALAVSIWLGIVLTLGLLLLIAIPIAAGVALIGALAGGHRLR